MFLAVIIWIKCCASLELFQSVVSASQQNTKMFEAHQHGTQTAQKHDFEDCHATFSVISFCCSFFLYCTHIFLVSLLNIVRDLTSAWGQVHILRSLGKTNKLCWSEPPFENNKALEDSFLLTDFLRETKAKYGCCFWISTGHFQTIKLTSPYP